MAIQAGSDTRARTYFDAFDRNAIGACYQLGFLVLPPLTPILVWLALDQKMIKDVLLEGVWTATESDARALQKKVSD